MSDGFNLYSDPDILPSISVSSGKKIADSSVGNDPNGVIGIDLCDGGMRSLNFVKFFEFIWIFRNGSGLCPIGNHQCGESRLPIGVFS